MKNVEPASSFAVQSASFCIKLSIVPSTSTIELSPLNTVLKLKNLSVFTEKSLLNPPLANFIPPISRIETPALILYFSLSCLQMFVSPSISYLYSFQFGRHS